MRRPFDAPQTILITGASSGIGAALARRYAAPRVRLALSGRNNSRLESTAEDCRQQGAEVTSHLVDVADRAAMASLIASLDGQFPLDLVIANAGIDGTAFSDDERPYGIFAVNVGGVFHTVLPALERMRGRGHGQIAIVSSLVGYLGLPGAAEYAASKAAVRVWGEALRRRHLDEGIAISIICPGFIDSRITATNEFAMPFKWPAERAARHIIIGLARGKGRIAFPWPLKLSIGLAALLPGLLLDPILAHVPPKPPS